MTGTGTSTADDKGKKVDLQEDNGAEKAATNVIDTTKCVKKAAIPSGSGGHDSSFWKSPLLKRG